MFEPTDNNPQSSHPRSGSENADRRYVPSKLHNSRPEASGDVTSRFGSRLRQLRRDSNLTQMQMATLFGMDRCYISEVERGRKSVSLVTLELIALGFELSLSDVVADI